MTMKFNWQAAPKELSSWVLHIVVRVKQAGAETARLLVSILGKSTKCKELVRSLQIGEGFLDQVQHLFAGLQENIPIVTAVETQSIPGVGKVSSCFHLSSVGQVLTALSIDC